MRQIIFILFSFFTSVAYSEIDSFCDGSNLHPCIVQDTSDDSTSIKNLRHMMNITEIWMSGSGTTTEEGWKSLVAYIKKLTDGKVKYLINVDLREESHGFLNGQAINLTSEFNWINKGKAAQQSLRDEKAWLEELKKQTIITNVLTPKQFKSNNFEGHSIPVMEVATEKEVTERLGFNYVRLTVTDHMAPRSSDVDKFIRLIDQLPEASWVHIHCRAGEGRTTTFMAMYDMLRNADQVSFDDIIKRQASLSPYYDLSQFNRKNSSLRDVYYVRYIFLKRFYHFANEKLKGNTQTWSQWDETHA